MPTPLQPESLDSRLAKRLAAAFLDAGWNTETDSELTGGSGADLVVRKGRHVYAVQVKTSRDGRRSALEALTAEAIVRGRAAARGLKGAAPLAVVGAPKLSPALVQDVRLFVERFGEGIAWGVLDEAGTFDLVGPGLFDVAAASTGGGTETGQRRGLVKSVFRSQSVDIFSDLGQWCIKAILSHRLPQRLRITTGARIDEPISNATHLSSLIGVSLPTAARVVAGMRDQGFLEEGTPLRPVRTDELLRRWRSANMVRSPVEIRARWIFPSGDSAAQLVAALQRPSYQRGSRACLALFAACDALGFPLVKGVAPHVYLEDVSHGALEKIGLVPAAEGEGVDVFVRVPRFPESVFRGAVVVDHGFVADLLQCWLDVSEHVARGEEMAAFLRTQALSALLPDTPDAIVKGARDDRALTAKTGKARSTASPGHKR